MRQAPPAFSEPVYVTRPLLPPLEEFVEQLQQIWVSKWMTNSGGRHAALEQALMEHLRVSHLSLFANGTIALMAACQALELTGEVITTPFTFPATPHALSWNRIKPVFADIDPDSLTIDPNRIEELIGPRTSAILGVHVYGIPCDVDGIGRLAERHGLRVIYDGAHAFGTEIDGRPVTDFGDATMLSFHATKLFHTAEGGALIVREAETKRRVDLLKNFGIKNETEVILPGINGKMNELQAALGLINLRYIDAERSKRERMIAVYRERLAGLPGVRCVRMPPGVRDSCQYFVIRIRPENGGRSCDEIYQGLKAFNIHTRRYFYPLCSEYGHYSGFASARPEHLPVAHEIVKEVLSLPLYGELGEEGAHRICDCISYLLYR
jgi:dTDP-4-amino-4,6-dideoxygalactose transaminase